MHPTPRPYHHQGNSQHVLTTGPTTTKPDPRARRVHPAVANPAGARRNANTSSAGAFVVVVGGSGWVVDFHLVGVKD